MKAKFTEEQFMEKYNLYVQLIFRIAYGYTKNTQDSEDIVQNVFIKYLDNNKIFKTLNDEKYWLIRVTINESINFNNSCYNKKIILNEEMVLSTADTALDNNKYKDLLFFLDKAPKKFKQILIFYYFYDLNILEIAKTLNLSESAVKMRLKRARDYLKKKMEGINNG